MDHSQRYWESTADCVVVRRSLTAMRPYTVLIGYTVVCTCKVWSFIF